MSKRRILVLLLVLIVAVCVAVLVIACQSRNKPAEPAETAQTEEETEEEVQSEYLMTMYVTAEEGLVLRKGPGSENEELGKLSYGQELQIEEAREGWAKVTVDGQTGWCSMEYLTSNKDKLNSKDSDKKDSEKEKGKSSDYDLGKLVQPDNFSDARFKGHVDSKEGLNMRYGPGQQYGIITAIPDKTSLTGLASQDGWVFVDYDGKNGWVSGEYFVTEDDKAKDHD